MSVVLCPVLPSVPTASTNMLSPEIVVMTSYRPPHWLLLVCFSERCLLLHFRDKPPMYRKLALNSPWSLVWPHTQSCSLTSVPESWSYTDVHYHAWLKGDLYHCLLQTSPPTFFPKSVASLLCTGLLWLASPFPGCPVPHQGPSAFPSLSLRLRSSLWISFTEVCCSSWSLSK